jgi:hypothetical protein
LNTIDNGLVNAALNFFSCTELTDDVSVVPSVQGLECHSNEYKHLRPIFIVLGVYLFALPVGMFIGLCVLNHKKELTNEKSRSRYGFLFQSYASNRWYWETLVLARRAILVALSASIADRYSRAAGLTFANIVFCIGHIYAK